jgi:hypothetical protein
MRICKLKKTSKGVIAVVLSVAFFTPEIQADAQLEKPLGQLTDNLRLTGEFRARPEIFNFFRSTGANNNNDYHFWSLRARLGLEFSSEYADVFVQGEYSGDYGLPDNSFGKPGGALGLGAMYYSENNNDTNVSNVHLKQAYLNAKLAAVGLPGANVKFGRFEIKEGLEYKTGEEKFDMLKTTRVSQRLLGTFDFANASRNFDGVAISYDQPLFNITTSATHPTQGGFNLNAQDEISKIDLVYAALTAKKEALLPGTEGRLFYLYYGDNRDVQVVDNRAEKLRPKLSQQSLKIHTIGTHWLSVQKLDSGAADALLWGAYQFGNWGNLNHQAYAFDVEAGYQFSDVMLKPWFRAGYFQGSGDNNPNNGTHGTFFQVLPTVRLYAKFPFFNMMNINDAFAQLLLTPAENIKIAMDYHHLELNSGNDLFYAGAGATSRKTFGFLGRVASGLETVGELVDFSFNHTINKYFSWNVYYGHAFGGNYIQNFYTTKRNADFAFIELNASF